MTRFSRIVTQSSKQSVDWEDTEIPDITEATDEYIDNMSEVDEENGEKIEELMDEVERLKKENQELKSQGHLKEMQARKQLTAMYMEMYKKLEEDYKNRMANMEEQHEDLRDLAIEQTEQFYKQKLKQISGRKRSRSQMSEEEDEDEIEALETENTRLKAKIETLKKALKDQKKATTEIEGEKNNIGFQLALSTNELKNSKELLSALQKKSIGKNTESSEQMAELLKLIEIKNERIQTLKEFLDEAKDEYINITDHAGKMEVDLKNTHELLASKQEHIHDLEAQLQQASDFSAQQRDVIESLEEELESQAKKYQEAGKLFAPSPIEPIKTKELEERLEEKDALLKQMEASKAEVELRLQISVDENVELREKLRARIEEIKSCQETIQQTNSRVDTLSQKLEEVKITQIEQKEQADLVEKEVYNTSCQTADFPADVDEKALQTSFCPPLNETLQEELKSTKESLNNLQLEFEEAKQTIENTTKTTQELQVTFESKATALQQDLDVKIKLEQQHLEEIISLTTENENLKNKLTVEQTDNQEIIESLNNRVKSLESELAVVVKSENEKDLEITQFQKEMKVTIRNHENSIQLLENELKSALQKLTASEDQLKKEKERFQKSEKEFKQVLNLLEHSTANNAESVKEKEKEIQRYKEKINDIKASLIEKQREFDAFKENRDKIVERQDDLIQAKSQEVQLREKEINRLQEILQEKKENTLEAPRSSKSSRHLRSKKILRETSSEVDATSEEERFDLKKEFLSPNNENIPIFEYSGSERSAKSGRSAKSSIKDSTISKSQKLKAGSKKRLLFNANESIAAEIEPEDIASPMLTRSTRKKPASRRRN